MCYTTGFSMDREILPGVSPGNRRPAKRSLNTKSLRKPFSAPKRPSPEKRHFLTYEPSNAIYTNTSDYRRWCRVTEWFNQFGPDAENRERPMNPIKMDT